MFLTLTGTCYFEGPMLTKRSFVILNECLKNIFQNLIPNRIIKCNYRHPPWMTDDMKTKLKERPKQTKKYYKNANMKSDFDKAVAKSKKCTEAISAAKDKYIKLVYEKLNDPLTAPKTYWKISNRLLSNKKVPDTPPLLFDGEIISNNCQKTTIFNKYFASQCTPLQNSSNLPTLRLRTDKTFSSLSISEDDIFAVIENLNSKKSYGSLKSLCQRTDKEKIDPAASISSMNFIAMTTCQTLII